MARLAGQWQAGQRGQVARLFKARGSCRWTARVGLNRGCEKGGRAGECLRLGPLSP